MRKGKKKKKINIRRIIVLIIILLIIFGSIIYFLVSKNNKEKNILKNKNNLIADINKHYNKYVITNKKTKLYNKDNKVIGEINKDINLNLVVIDKIDENNKYLEISDFKDTYILYSDIDKIDEITIDSRYKNYIPFNINIKTNDKTTFYDEYGELLYSLNGSYELPVYIKDSDMYGVEFNNSLVYIKKDDIKEEFENKNTDKFNSSGVAVLNYHFFYDEDNPDDKGCNEEICASKSQFKSHLDYFKDNNIFTIKMHELELYMDGKLRLPKSVLITIDDGVRTKLGVDMLTEYKMYGTIFLITSWYDVPNYYVTDYIELHSHSHNMHNGGKCSGGQGAEIKCLDRDTILDDLKKSRELLNNTTAFCYPFYEYNSYSEGLLKEAGFTMAFIGEKTASYGPYKLAEVNGDKMKIPRFVVVTYTTMSELKKYFNEIK